MFDMNNEENKSAVILNPERSEWVSRSHVTGVEHVVNDGAKTQCYSAKRDFYGDFAYAQPLKMTEKALSFLRLRGASGAQGISTLALCLEAHKRRFLFNSWILRFAFAPFRMTIPTLALLLSLNLSTSWAADSCKSDEKVCGTGCIAESMECKSCGGSCYYTQTTDGAVTLYGSGEVPGIDNYTFKNVGGVYHYYSGDTADTKHQFYYNSDITSISFDSTSNFTTIGSHAFQGASGLTSITIPDSLTGIGGYAFYGESSLTEIIIPDSLTAEQITKLKYAGLKSGLTVYCQGATGTCKAALDDAGYEYAGVIPADSTRCSGKYIYDTTCRQRNENECNSVAKYYYNSSANNGAGQCQLLPKTQSACTGNGLAWDPTSSKCTNTNYTPSQEVNNGGTSGDDTGGDDIGDISGDFNPADCYNKGQVPYDNQCWDEYPFAKKRWTPAEAAQWLHDGNDNFVVITFKK